MKVFDQVNEINYELKEKSIKLQDLPVKSSDATSNMELRGTSFGQAKEFEQLKTRKNSRTLCNPSGLAQSEKKEMVVANV